VKQIIKKERRSWKISNKIGTTLINDMKKRNFPENQDRLKTKINLTSKITALKRAHGKTIS